MAKPFYFWQTVSKIPKGQKATLLYWWIKGRKNHEDFKESLVLSMSHEFKQMVLLHEYVL